MSSPLVCFRAADTEPKEAGKDDVHAEADAARFEQLQAVAVVGKVLCSPGCLSYRHFRWLAAHLMSKVRFQAGWRKGGRRRNHACCLNTCCLHM